MIISAYQLTYEKWNERELKGIKFPCFSPSIKLLSREIINLAFRDLTREKLSKVIFKVKKSAHEFLNSEWGELCAVLAGIENLKSLYEKNKGGIKLNHFEITRRSRKRKPYKRRVKGEK